MDASAHGGQGGGSDQGPRSGGYSVRAAAEQPTTTAGVTVYQGNALAHQRLPVTATKRPQLAPLTTTPAAQGEAEGLRQSAAWTYARCQQQLLQLDADEELRITPQTEVQEEWTAGYRRGIATRMAQRADDPAVTR